MGLRVSILSENFPVEWAAQLGSFSGIIDLSSQMVNAPYCSSVTILIYFPPQSQRIEDQRSEAPSAPTVPDEDFFGLILRLQSNRMDDQRSSGPGGHKHQLQARR